MHFISRFSQGTTHLARNVALVMALVSANRESARENHWSFIFFLLFCGRLEARPSRRVGQSQLLHIIGPSDPSEIDPKIC